MNMIHYLRLQAAKGIGTAAQRKVLNHIATTNSSLPEFFQASVSDWKQAGLISSQIEALQASEELAMKWQEELVRKKIQVIGQLDDNYPKRLNQVLTNQSPPILYFWGNWNLLQNPSIGFCGSRNASEQGINITKDTAKQIAQKGWTIVSGHAKGIDFTAHRTALENDGTTIIVAPEGILEFRLQEELKKLAGSGKILILSEFQPNSHWSVANAMTRNHTICGLSDALVVVESGLSGGTFEAGKFAIRVQVPLFVADYTEPEVNAPGNPYFIQSGAEPVRQNPQTHRANLHRLFTKVENHYVNLEKPIPKQKMLFAHEQFKL
ncbi:MAG: DNA-protecting protein DprA [Acidobacteria bacterium]|nr:DNA-protecting protein DprA [Acidobacteriota bacterium]